MPIRFHDLGLQDVWLINGYTTRTTEFGKSVRYLALEALFDAFARALILKPTRLESGEFRWLRHHLELNQKQLAELIGRDVQTVSLIERGSKPSALIDRELRRLANERLALEPHDSLSVQRLADRTKRIGTAKYYGQYEHNQWNFQIVVAAPDDLMSVLRTETVVVCALEQEYRSQATHHFQFVVASKGASNCLADASTWIEGYDGPTTHLLTTITRSSSSGIGHHARS